MTRAVPVVVGVGQVVQRRGDGDRDSIGLMVDAVHAAAADAGVPELSSRVDMVLVPEGTWPHRDAARIVASRLGAEDATTVVSRIGVLQTTLFGLAATAISKADASVVLVVGGEAKASGSDPVEPVDPSDGDEPDIELAPGPDMWTALEVERGLAVPAQSYALQEDAIRRFLDESVIEHRERLAGLWSCFSDVATTNPYAWDREYHDADAIADPASPGNRMVSSPYTKRHCSQWNVDQSVAILMVSNTVADELGIASERRVHPVAVVDSNAMITLTARAELFRSPSFAVAGRRLAEATGVAPSEVDHVELYSCFPSAVEIQSAELGIGEVPLTVTGGMAFAGGPLNSAGLHGLASMVDVLRGDPNSTGLVTAISGWITKGGVSLWSVDEPPTPFEWHDVTDEVLIETATVEVDGEHAGDVEVEATTVAYDREGPGLAIALGRSADGRRVVAQSNDRELAAAVASQPPDGTVRVEGERLVG
jgi:acetyl-CoA C-acetyltransferase